MLCNEFEKKRKEKGEKGDINNRWNKSYTC
jgi:hypothetical protein